MNNDIGKQFKDIMKKQSNLEETMKICDSFDDITLLIALASSSALKIKAPELYAVLKSYVATLISLKKLKKGDE